MQEKCTGMETLLTHLVRFGIAVPWVPTSLQIASPVFASKNHIPIAARGSHFGPGWVHCNFIRSWRGHKLRKCVCVHEQRRSLGCIGQFVSEHRGRDRRQGWPCEPGEAALLSLWALATEVDGRSAFWLGTPRESLEELPRSLLDCHRPAAAEA